MPAMKGEEWEDIPTGDISGTEPLNTFCTNTGALSLMSYTLMMNLEGRSRDLLFVLSMMRAVSSYSAFFSLSSLSKAYTSPLVSSTLKMVLAYSPSMMYLALLFLTLDVIWKERVIQRDKGGICSQVQQRIDTVRNFSSHWEQEQPSGLLLSAGATLSSTTAAAGVTGWHLSPHWNLRAYTEKGFLKITPHIS